MRLRMSLSKAPRYLLDVNVLVALTTRSHVHHELVKKWFYSAPESRVGHLRIYRSGLSPQRYRAAS